MSYISLSDAFAAFALPGYTPGIVTLIVNGMRYEGWEEVDISRSVKQMAGEFRLEVSERFAGDGMALFMNWPIKPGDSCKVLYSGVLAVTGYVDAYQPHYTHDKHEIRIQGRSKTADMVDSSAEADVEGGEMRKVGLDQIARKIAAPHGIKVRVDADLKEIFDPARVEPGETKHEFLERYARPAGVCLTDTAEGELRLLQVKNGAPAASLIEGINILEAGATLRADNRFSDYEVKGQEHGRDGAFGRRVSEIKARHQDHAVKRYRPFRMLNETKTSRSSARNRARWESAARSGESTRAEVKVLGWFCAEGKLWTPGDKVQLTSPMLKIDRVMAIEAVKFNQKGETVTSLSLVPVEALNPNEASAGSGSKSSDGAMTKPGNDASWINTKGTGGVA